MVRDLEAEKRMIDFANRSVLLALVGMGLSNLACSEGKAVDDGTSGSSTDGLTSSSSGDGDDTTDTTGGTVNGDGDGSKTSCAQAGQDLGPSVLRRLSRVEYQLTVQDLFRLTEPPSIQLIPEDIVQDGFTSFSEVQSISAQHLRAYLDTATALFDELNGDPLRMEQVVGCDPLETSCLSSFVTSFGRLAYRRALTTEEVTELVQAATTHALDAVDQIRYATQALLTSAHFLFRVELGDQKEGLSRLSAQELAAKLSFTIWGRSPSVALLDQADAGDLDTDDGLATLAADMLSDPKAEFYYKQFFREWLGYSILRPPLDPPSDWSDELMPLMKEETDALVAEYAWQPEKNLWDMLTTNHSNIAPELAAFYGVSSNAQGRVEFASDDPRANAGVLGHASLLSQKTDGDKVAVRGNWLRRTFLCEDLHIPPGLAEILGEQLVGLTSMQIIAERNEEVTCKTCHEAIDPIGVGLAQFDATGRFDSSVDLSSYPIAPGFPDAKDPVFSSLSELAAKLRAMPELSHCLTEQAFIYALGRAPQAADACAFEDAEASFTTEGGSFSALLRGLALSSGFRFRRAPTASTSP